MSPDGDRRQGTHYSGRRWTRMRFMHLCVERFEHQANVEVKWAELTKADSWRRDDYIKESGFATPPGSTSPNARIADVCAEALSKIIAMQTPAAK
jgi:hypothetical protein